MNALNLFEIGILNGIQELFGGPFCDAVMPIITLFAEKGVFWIALAAIMICFKKTRKTGWMIGIALILGVVIGNGVIKPLVARPRPFMVDPSFEARLLIPALYDGSFPSGHALACFEGAGVLLMTKEYRNKMGWAALVIALLVSFSRVYLAVHYPTDVVAGALLGLLFAWLGILIVNKAYDVIGKKWPDLMKAGKTEKTEKDR